MIWTFVGTDAVGMTFDQDKVAATVMEREATFFRNDMGLVQDSVSQVRGNIFFLFRLTPNPINVEFYIQKVEKSSEVRHF
jgi:hypothetical protein